MQVCMWMAMLHAVQRGGARAEPKLIAGMFSPAMYMQRDNALLAIYSTMSFPALVRQAWCLHEWLDFETKMQSDCDRTLGRVHDAGQLCSHKEY